MYQIKNVAADFDAGVEKANQASYKQAQQTVKGGMGAARYTQDNPRAVKNKPKNALADKSWKSNTSTTTTTKKSGFEKYISPTKGQVRNSNTIATEAYDFFQANPSFEVGSRSLDDWLHDNGYSGQASTEFKTYLKQYGASSERRSANPSTAFKANTQQAQTAQQVMANNYNEGTANTLATRADTLAASIVKQLNSDKYSSADERETLQKEIYAYRDTLNRLKSMGYEVNTEEADGYIQQMLAASVERSRVFSQFKDEAEYSAALDAMQYAEDVEKMDVKAEKSKLKPIKAAYEKASAIIGRGYHDVKGEGGGDQLAKQKEADAIAKKAGFKNYDELKSYVSLQDAKIKQAKMKQTTNGLADSAMTAADFKQKAEIGAQFDGSPENWNAVLAVFATGADSTVINSALSENYAYGLDAKDVRNMTQDELRVYCYYNATEPEKAKQYMRGLAETLELRTAQQKFGDIQGKAGKEILSAVPSALSRWGRAVDAWASQDEDYFGQTSSMLVGQMAREDLGEQGRKIGGYATFDQVVYDLVDTATYMGPSILTSTIASALGSPAAGVGLSSALMFASSGGDAYTEAINNGFTKQQANLYAAITGASETTLQNLIGGISKLSIRGLTGVGLKTSEDFAAKAVAKIAKVAPSLDNAFTRFALDFGIKSAGEFTEEYLQEILNPLFRNIAFAEDNEVPLFTEDALYSGILGAMSSGLFEGRSTVVRYANPYLNSIVQGGNIKLSEQGMAAFKLIEFGSQFAKGSKTYAKAYELSKTIKKLYNEGKAGKMNNFFKEVSNADLGELRKLAAEELSEFGPDAKTDAQRQAQTEALHPEATVVSPTAQRLIDAGLTTEEAVARAKVFEAIANGENVSNSDIDAVLIGRKEDVEQADITRQVFTELTGVEFPENATKAQLRKAFKSAKGTALNLETDTENTATPDAAAPAIPEADTPAQVANPADAFLPKTLDNGAEVVDNGGNNTEQGGTINGAEQPGTAESGADVLGRQSGTGPDTEVQGDGLVGREDTELHESSLLSPKLKNAYQKSGVVPADVEVTKDKAAFCANLDAARDADVDHGWAVSPKTVEEIADNSTILTTPSGDAGLIITADGDIEGLYKNPNSPTQRVATTLIPMAIEMGGVKLDCYGEGLLMYYASFGFYPVARVEFNAEYANPGWDESKGTPYVYVMAHNGDSAAKVVETRAGERYTLPTDEELNALPTYGKDSYDEAIALRDSLLEKRGTLKKKQRIEFADGSVMTREDVAQELKGTHNAGGQALTKAEINDILDAMVAMNAAGERVPGGPGKTSKTLYRVSEDTMGVNETGEELTQAEKWYMAFVSDTLINNGVKTGITEVIYRDPEEMKGEDAKITGSTMEINKALIHNAALLNARVGHELFHRGDEAQRTARDVADDEDTEFLDNSVKDFQLVDEYWDAFRKMGVKTQFTESLNRYFSDPETALEAKRQQYKEHMLQLINPETGKFYTEAELDAKLTDAYIKPEIVADWIGEAFADRNVLVELAGTDPSLVYKIYDTLSNLRTGLRARYDPKVKAVRDMEKLMDSRIAELYDTLEIAAELSNEDPNIREKVTEMSWQEQVDTALTRGSILANTGNLKGTHDEMGNSALYIPKTPKVYTDMGLDQAIMGMTQTHVYKAQLGGEYLDDGRHVDRTAHDVPVEVLKQLPQLLEKPVAVMDSTKASRPGRIIAVLNAVDEKGWPVAAIIAPTKINGRAKIDGDERPANFIESVYGLEDFDLLLKSSRYTMNLFDFARVTDGLYYLNRERLDDLYQKLDKKRSQLPDWWSGAEGRGLPMGVDSGKIIKQYTPPVKTEKVTKGEETRLAVTTDEWGTKLPDAVVKHFENSVMRDGYTKNGGLIRWYHGTDELVHSVFDPSANRTEGVGTFWTRDPEAAVTYAVGTGHTPIDTYDVGGDGRVYAPDTIGTAEERAAANKKAADAKTAMNEASAKVTELSRQLREVQNKLHAADVSEVAELHATANELQTQYTDAAEAYRNLRAEYETAKLDAFRLSSRGRKDVEATKKLAEKNSMMYRGKKTRFDEEGDIILARGGLPGVYEAFLNFTDPFIIDCQGRPWSDLDDVSQGHGTFTDQVATSVYENTDHDGVVFRNIVDGGGILTDVAVQFFADQSKGTQNEAPTDSPDFRFRFSDDSEQTRFALSDSQDFQNFINAVLTRRVSDVRSNTYARSGLFTQVEKQMEGLREQDMTYDPTTEQQSMAEAQRRLNEDYDGEKKKLRSNGQAWGSVDLDMAMGVLSDELAAARASKDYKDVIRWAQIIRRKGTQAGQFIQAFAKYTRSAEGVLVRAADDLRRSRLPVAEQEALLKRIGEFSETLSGIKDGDKQGLIDLIIKQANQRETPIRKGVIKELGRQNFQYLYGTAITQLDQIAKDYTPSGAGKKLSTYQTMAQLLNLRTGERNVISNAVFNLLDTVANDVAMAPDLILGAFSGRRTVGFENQFSKTRRQGSKDARGRTRIEVALDVAPDTAVDKYGTARRTWKMVGSQNALGMTKVGKAGAKILSSAEKLMGFELNWTDESTKGGIRAMVDKSLAPYVEKGWITQEEADAFAEQEALYRTFQDDTAMGYLLGQLKKGLNAFGIGGETIRDNTFGLGDFVVKYTQVPGALITRSVEYSPVGAAKALWHLGKFIGSNSSVRKARADLLHVQDTYAAEAASGDAHAQGMIEDAEKTLQAAIMGTNAEQRKAAMFLSRSFTGTGLVTLFAAAALKGVLKRADDEDDADAKALQSAQGIGGTQLNLDALMRMVQGEDTRWRDGDMLAATDFLEPLNALMTMGSLVAKSEECQNVWDMFQNPNVLFNEATMDALYYSIGELSVMQTLGTIQSSLQYYDENSELGRFPTVAVDVARSSLTGFIPAPVRQTATALDPYYRDLYASKGAWDKTVAQVQYTLPRYRENLPEKLDNFGKVKEQEQDALLRALNAYAIPGSLRTYQSNAVIDELGDVYLQSANANIYPDRSAPYKVELQSTSYDLTLEERQQYQRTRGRYAEQYIQDAMGNPFYQGMRPDEKADVLAAAKNLANYMAKKNYAESHNLEYSSPEYEGMAKAMNEGISLATYKTVGSAVNGMTGDDRQDQVMNYLIEQNANGNMSQREVGYFFAREYSTYQLKEPDTDADGNIKYTKTGKMKMKATGEVDWDKLTELGWYNMLS